MAKPYALQKQEHIRNYQKMFNRVNVTLGTKTADMLPTDERLAQFQQDPRSDNGLPVLFFQFGRYLLISSSRVGLLPLTFRDCGQIKFKRLEQRLSRGPLTCKCAIGPWMW